MCAWLWPAICTFCRITGPFACLSVERTPKWESAQKGDPRRKLSHHSCWYSNPRPLDYQSLSLSLSNTYIYFRHHYAPLWELNARIYIHVDKSVTFCQHIISDNIAIYTTCSLLIWTITTSLMHFPVYVILFCSFRSHQCRLLCRCLQRKTPPQMTTAVRMTRIPMLTACRITTRL